MRVRLRLRWCCVVVVCEVVRIKIRVKTSVKVGKKVGVQNRFEVKVVEVMK